LRDEIIVEQVRELIDSFLYLTSHRQGAKVVLIYLAEEMNTAAANAREALRSAELARERALAAEGSRRESEQRLAKAYLTKLGPASRGPS